MRRKLIKSSLFEDRYVEMGDSDDWGKSRFECVVRMNLDSVAPVGIFSSMSSRREVIVVDGGARKTRVGGRPRPLKVDMRTLRCSLIVADAMLENGNEYSDAIAAKTAKAGRPRLNDVCA